MGDREEPFFFWGGGRGLEGANKNKIGPKNVKIGKKIIGKNQISFLTRKCLNRLIGKIFFLQEKV